MSLDPVLWFWIYFLSETMSSPTLATTPARFRIILQITGRRHGQSTPQENLDMGLDKTHLRRSSQSADGIAASVEPHSATSWTTPYPDFLGRWLSILERTVVDWRSHTDGSCSQLAPSSVRSYAGRNGRPGGDGQRLVVYALGQACSKRRNCFPLRIDWLKADTRSQPVSLLGALLFEINLKDFYLLPPLPCLDHEQAA